MIPDEPTTVAVPMLFRETEVEVCRDLDGEGWLGTVVERRPAGGDHVGTERLRDDSSDEAALLWADGLALRSIALRGAVKHRQTVRRAAAEAEEHRARLARIAEQEAEQARIAREVERWRVHLDLDEGDLPDWSGPDVLERLVGLGITAPTPPAPAAARDWRTYTPDELDSLWPVGAVVYASDPIRPSSAVRVLAPARHGASGQFADRYVVCTDLGAFLPEHLSPPPVANP